MTTQLHRCSICQRDDVRLYRYYGRFLRADEIFCKRHIPQNDMITVPLIEDEYGDAWGSTSVPEDAWKRWDEMGEE